MQCAVSLRVEEDMAVRMNGYAGKEVVFGIRPESIADKSCAPDAPAERTVEAVAEVVEPMGAETYVYLASGAHSFVARLQPADRVSLNQKVSLVFDMRRAHFFDPGTGKSLA